MGIHELLAGWVTVLGYWAARSLLDKRKRRPIQGGKFKIEWSPADNYKAGNPWWLVEASQGGPSVRPLPPSDQCPQLIKFRDQVRSGNRNVTAAAADQKQELFQLEDSVTYLNHGSYGATLRLASQVQRWYQERMEAQPVRFMESELLPCLAAAVADVAELIGASWRDVVPVTNATGAVNAVIQSVSLGRGDLILMTNITYPAVKSTIVRRAAACGAGTIEVSLGFKEYQDEAMLLAAFADALRAGGRRIKLVVLDHVVSFPPVVMPIRQLASMAAQYGARVLVDGAHATGSLDGLDVPSYGAHYYVSNLHKWMCTPKGTAYLWVRPQEQDGVKPLITSHGHGLGFRGEFLWQGTADCSPWLAVPASLAVLQSFGLTSVIQHNHQLVEQAASLLLHAWGTKDVVGVGGPGGTAGMAAVQLPFVLPPTPANAVRLQKLLRSQHHIEVPVICWDQRLWVRISAQLYNQLADYQKLADTILSICTRNTNAPAQAAG